MNRMRVALPHRQIKDFCLKWKVSEMALFGSVLSDNFRPDSDIDVLVSFQNDAEWGLFEFVDMSDELEAIFGRKVDLVEKEAMRNPFRKQAILAAHEVIYAA
ncbi:MAG: nucleotidyltransferase family protein [Phycisphaerae bacterium]|nr:nucleotidyltransferase family protein [Phycisphaerae bacterium]